MNALVILLLIIGIICVSISWFKRDLQCPPPQIIYRYVQANDLDTQFSKENLPSNLYSDMFNNDNIWIGGMSMSMGKTVGLSIPKKNYVSPFTTTPAPFTTTPSPFTTTPAPFTTTPAPFTTTEIPEIQETEMPEIQEFPEIEELNYQENFSIPFMSMTSTIKPSDYNAGPITGPYGI